MPCLELGDVLVVVMARESVVYRHRLEGGECDCAECQDRVSECEEPVWAMQQPPERSYPLNGPRRCNGERDSPNVRLVIRKPLAGADEVKGGVDDHRHRQAEADEVDIASQEPKLHGTKYKSAPFSLIAPTQVRRRSGYLPCSIISRVGVGPLIGTKNSNDSTEYRDIVGVEFHRLHFGVLRLEHYSRSLGEEPLHRGLAFGEPRYDDLAGLGVRLSIHDQKISGEDSYAGHRLASDLEDETFTTASELRGNGHHLVGVLIGEHASPGGDITDEGDSSD